MAAAIDLRRRNSEGNIYVYTHGHIAESYQNSQGNSRSNSTESTAKRKSSFTQSILKKYTDEKDLFRKPVIDPG